MDGTQGGWARGRGIARLWLCRCAPTEFLSSRPPPFGARRAARADRTGVDRGVARHGAGLGTGLGWSHLARLPGHARRARRPSPHGLADVLLATPRRGAALAGARVRGAG